MEPDKGSKLPMIFAERMGKQLGAGIHEFLESMNQDSPVSVRLHPRWGKGPLIPEKVPWCSNGYYLPERPLFTADPYFHGGMYYVQEAGSMFLEQAFKSIQIPSPALVLDLCAAPGGKSTHLLSLLRPEDLLISNETIRGRCAVLQENVQKWGYPNVVITQNDPQDFGRMKSMFDLIVTDVPCSGEGLFRKESASLSEWSPGNTLLCAARQKRILTEVWKCLKPGGYLIYSTCTFNPEENENNIQWLHEQSDAIPLEIMTDPGWNIETIRQKNISGYQFYPHRTRSEGFFLGVVRKPGALTSSGPGRITRNPWPFANNQIADTLRNWIVPEIPVAFPETKEGYSLFPEFWAPILSTLEKNLTLIQVGTPAASGKLSKPNPHPALAHSVLIDKTVFTHLHLSLKDAIRYLQKDSWEIDHAVKEWMIASYKDIPLGWLKNIGTRFNNYFPKERRIRMQIPEVPLPWHEIKNIFR